MGSSPKPSSTLKVLLANWANLLRSWLSCVHSKDRVVISIVRMKASSTSRVVHARLFLVTSCHCATMLTLYAERLVFWVVLITEYFPGMKVLMRLASH